MTFATWALAAAIVFHAYRSIRMSTATDNLATQVAALTTVASSAVALIETLADKFKAIAGDEAAVNALADEIKGDATKLGDAVVANTPAA